jgi:hypothetical protein
LVEWLAGLDIRPTIARPHTAMKKKLLLLALLLALAPSAPAEEPQPKFGDSASTSILGRTGWNTNPAYWERALSEKRVSPMLRLGKSGFVIHGLAFEGSRRQQSSGDRSWGKRLLGLPIVRLFVPQPMASPPGGGNYFCWGESDRPWTAIAEGAAAGDLSNLARHEARTSLISISR